MSPLNITQPLDSTRYMVYNGYYKVMSNIPKMGHLTTPVYIYILYLFIYHDKQCGHVPLRNVKIPYKEHHMVFQQRNPVARFELRFRCWNHSQCIYNPKEKTDLDSKILKDIQRYSKPNPIGGWLQYILPILSWHLLLRYDKKTKLSFPSTTAVSRGSYLSRSYRKPYRIHTLEDPN